MKIYAQGLVNLAEKFMHALYISVGADQSASVIEITASQVLSGAMLVSIIMVIFAIVIIIGYNITMNHLWPIISLKLVRAS